MKKKQEIIKGIEQVAQTCIPCGGRLLLYGSQARGDSHPGSDWDLLILLDKDKIEKEDHDNVAFPFTYYGWEINESIIPIIYTVAEWEKFSYTPFYKNVEQDKTPIYESK